MGNDDFNWDEWRGAINTILEEIKTGQEELFGTMEKHIIDDNKRFEEVSARAQYQDGFIKATVLICCAVVAIAASTSRIR